MNSRRQFTLRTLCVVIAGVCVLSALGYYVRAFVSNIRVETHEIDLWEVEVQLVLGICRTPEWKNKFEGSLQSFENTLQSSTDDGERVFSAVALGELGKPGSTSEDQLINALNTDRPRVKRAAIFALGSMGSAKAKEKLQELLGSTDPRLSREAKLALEKLPNASSNSSAPAPNPPKK